MTRQAAAPMPELSIVVPVFHNEENLPDLIPALERACREIDAEFVLVDDGSRDGSWAWIERWVAREPRATGVKLSRNFGSFTACAAGLAYARGRAAVMISADLQDPPELIPEMLARWRHSLRWRSPPAYPLPVRKATRRCRAPYRWAKPPGLSPAASRRGARPMATASSLGEHRAPSLSIRGAMPVTPKR